MKNTTKLLSSVFKELLFEKYIPARYWQYIDTVEFDPIPDSWCLFVSVTTIDDKIIKEIYKALEPLKNKYGIDVKVTI